MPFELALSDLLAYTDWERGKWFKRLRQHDGPILDTSVGLHGDGRFETVGQLMRHIFSAEKRYVERLSDRPMTDTATIPAHDLDALFEFSQ